LNAEVFWLPELNVAGRLFQRPEMPDHHTLVLVNGTKTQGDLMIIAMIRWDHPVVA